MRRLLSRVPTLDFVVIGAQKAGTTSLWRYLEDNPGLRMPPAKESPFFTEAGYPHELGRYMRALFKDAPRSAKLGTVTVSYMLGANGVDVPTVAARIRDAFPHVRLVALLRDPVDRALSAHRMSLREHGETRSFRDAVREQLEPAELDRARRDPTPTNTYVVAGEYGRILEAYLAHFDREQLLVAFTADLERAPGDVVRRVCEHLGVAPHVPEHLGERFYPGGRPRVSPEAEADLKRYLARHVWPRMRHAAQHRTAFEFWLRLWNAEPGPPEEPPDDATAAALREHYAPDVERVAAIAGVEPPWATAYAPATNAPRRG
ncbi:MAG TPA: sulfotransferase [Solirubrobacteraceae bacterium]|nr:sulfotransferase [Solirubrobacteraceae bacterium]